MKEQKILKEKGYVSNNRNISKKTNTKSGSRLQL